MERVIRISETAKREASNRNNEGERGIHHIPPQRVTVTDSFPINDKESRRTESPPVNLKEGQ